MTEKRVVGGQVAVLISPGYGAGWSTWTSEYAETLLFHPYFVDLVENGVKDSDEFERVAKEILGPDAYVYCGGVRDLRIEWLPIGTRFCVEEYDGSESLRLADDLVYIA